MLSQSMLLPVLEGPHFNHSSVSYEIHGCEFLFLVVSACSWPSASHKPPSSLDLYQLNKLLVAYSEVSLASSSSWLLGISGQLQDSQPGLTPYRIPQYTPFELLMGDVHLVDAQGLNTAEPRFPLLQLVTSTFDTT